MRLNIAKRALVFAALLLAGLSGVSGFAQAQPAQPQKPAETKPASGTPQEKREVVLPAPLSGFSDEGKFFLYVNEDLVANMTFKWQADGTFDNKGTISMAGQTVTQTIKITPDKDGRWTRIDVETPLGPIIFVREGEIARTTFKEKKDTLALKPNATLYADLAPVLLSQVIRMYDRAKGGKQTFAQLVVPAMTMDVSLELKDKVERSIGGRDLQLTRYTFAIAGIEMTLWADQEGRLYLIEAPTQHATMVREGYESLRKPEETDPSLSKPSYEIKVDRAVGVAMRDGVKLSTDIYRPDAEGKFPVILVRTPYKKEMVELQARYHARRGYVFAVQDCRGRFGSPGVWEPFVNEAKDGYDAIEWLAGQNWSTGKVGMIGGSYLGWVQWWAARERPPHLVTIIPNVSPPDPFYNVPYEYGVFFLWGAIWWADVVQSEATGDLSGAALSTISEKKYHKLLRALPVIDLDKTVLGKENPYWRKWIEHSSNDSYWDQANFSHRFKDIRIPVFHQSGWFDGDGIGTKLNYLGMAGHKHPNQKLVLGPWGHTPEAHRITGDHDTGPESLVDMQRAYLRWFDYWLKGIDNGIQKEPLVSIFVMGTNKWLHGPTYPLPQTRFDKWYLSSGGRANTSTGDGRLQRDAPATDGSDRYTYDPGDPTPTPSFIIDPDEDVPEEAKKEKSEKEKEAFARAFHENVTKARKDVLVYVSEPFAQSYTFAGPMSAVLYASSSARDTDWFMRVMEVDEKGNIFQLGEGKIRARFRNSTRKPEMLKPGEVYQYTLDMWQTGITIPAGRRLRIEVASASFPLFSRNLNTGGNNETETKHVKAEQVIYHGKRYPSHILLPAIPGNGH